MVAENRTISHLLSIAERSQSVLNCRTSWPRLPTILAAIMRHGVIRFNDSAKSSVCASFFITLRSSDILLPSGPHINQIMEQRSFIAKIPQLSGASHLFCGCVARCAPRSLPQRQAFAVRHHGCRLYDKANLWAFSGVHQARFPRHPDPRDCRHPEQSEPGYPKEYRTGQRL